MPNRSIRCRQSSKIRACIPRASRYLLTSPSVEAYECLTKMGVACNALCLCFLNCHFLFFNSFRCRQVAQEPYAVQKCPLPAVIKNPCTCSSLLEVPIDQSKCRSVRILLDGDKSLKNLMPHRNIRCRQSSKIRACIPLTQPPLVWGCSQNNQPVTK